MTQTQFQPVVVIIAARHLGPYHTELQQRCRVVRADPALQVSESDLVRKHRELLGWGVGRGEEDHGVIDPDQGTVHLWLASSAASNTSAVLQTLERALEDERVARVIGHRYRLQGDERIVERSWDLGREPDEPALFGTLARRGISVYTVGPLASLVGHDGITLNLAARTPRDALAKVAVLAAQGVEALIVTSLWDLRANFAGQPEPEPAMMAMLIAQLTELERALPETGLLFIVAANGRQIYAVGPGAAKTDAGLQNLATQDFAPGLIRLMAL